MERAYNEIKEFADERFGVDRSVDGIIDHIIEEAHEVKNAYEDYSKDWTSKSEIVEEMADVLLLVMNLAARLNVSYDDLLQGTLIKLEIIRERKYRPVGNKMKHIPDGTAEFIRKKFIKKNGENLN